MEETQPANQIGRAAFAEWQSLIRQNVYTNDPDFIHTIRYWFKKDFKTINQELTQLGARIATELEPLVALNHFPLNLPRIEHYNNIGENIEKIIHHPSYIAAGDIIYGSDLLKHLKKSGNLLHCLSLFFLTSQAGEAGHNCPIACTAGMLRVFLKTPDFPDKAFFTEKLITPSFQHNYTGAQFLTEVQGGSDVGLNATYAKSEDGHYQIFGEKWFCSNANADLIFLTARFDENTSGTKGLGLFLVPAIWKGQRNHYTLRRLKEKFGTQTMATAEIDFHGAYAYPIGDFEHAFQLIMENVLHISRLFNSVCVVAMARRAYFIARTYAEIRIAFSHKIIDYPLVHENLARIKAENTALMAGDFAIIHLQDECDTTKNVEPLLLRLLVNIQKYLTAKLSVEHIHHALDMLAGNGAIESFSSIPRLLRDCIVCENWEGTHNVLLMQILKDMHKYAIQNFFLTYLQNEIKMIAANSPYKKMLTDELVTLEQEIKDFLQLSPSLQSLKIRVLVDRMGLIFCAYSLWREGLNQFATENSTSKLNCLDYFWILRISQKFDIADPDYLALIKKL
jgi:alkylation response protein AidB-like acyl-CoA dehydrogenase